MLVSLANRIKGELEHLVLGGEVVLHHAYRHAGLRGDVSHGDRIPTVSTGHPPQRVGDLLPPNRRIGLFRHESDGYGEYLINLFRLIGSPTYPPDERWLREVGRQTVLDPAADARHLVALRASGDRRAELSRVAAPTLVLHGEADPLQSLHAARETARAVPHARVVSYPEMGHDLPRPLWSSVITEIVALADRADAPVTDVSTP